MTNAASLTRPPRATSYHPPSQPNRRGTGMAVMLAGAISNQSGAAVGAHAFPVLGPAGVVAVRQLVAGVLLLSVARPRLHRLSWRQWWPCLLLAGIFATMNLSLYTAIDRIGLGLAVTLEFLGPLTVALLAARGWREFGLALLAAIGVYVLVLPGPSSDVVGLAIAALAAICWGCYIVVNGVAGQRLSGLQAPAVASLVAAVGYLPVLVISLSSGHLSAGPVLLAVLAGVLSSAVPYACDLTALRFVPRQFFGVFMSVNPVLAALAGVVLLGERLAAHEWLGIAIVVAANALATLRRR